MLNMPILKFEKSTNYLNEQLDLQLNNKQLVSDIISNINLILPNTSDENKTNYLNIQNSANTFLQIISQNITTIEELKIEIKHITYDLTEILSENNRKEKSKEYYIATISNVKNHIEQYTLKFQNLEKKLEQDNIDFNDFININNFKYNFVSNQNNDTYEFSSFSIDNQDFSNEPITQEEVTLTKKEEKIDELASEFKSMLSNLSEDEILNFNLENSLNLISSQAFENEENIIIEKFFSTSNLPKVEEVKEGTDTSVIDIPIELSTALEFEIKENETVENRVEIPENIKNEIDENKSENVIEESKTKSETSSIVIDYASIYGNYHNTNSTIEEGILSEYSSFSPISTSTLNAKTQENLPISNTENIELTDEDILNEILKEELDKNSSIEILDNYAPQILEVTPKKTDLENLSSIDENIDIQTSKSKDTSEELSNMLDDISDDALLAELLISDDTSDNEILLNIAENSEEESEVQKESTEKSNLENVNIENKPILEKEVSKKVTTTKIKYPNFSNYDLEEKIKIIKEASTNNDTLIISEKQNKIFLPYTIDELEKYLKSYPEVYNSLVEVVEQEFILPFDTFFKHPAKARFLETYNLIRNRQGKSIFSAFIYAFKLIGRYNLNPAIIAACKTEDQLDTYLYYLNSNNLNKFNLFKIIYEIAPL